MIEDDDIVEEEQLRVGDAVVVRVRVGDVLDPAAGAVAEEADCAAEERRELVFAFHAQRNELAVEQLDRIGSRRVDAQIAARLEADERVAPDVLAALDALEQKRLHVLAAAERRERDERRERVRA